MIARFDVYANTAHELTAQAQYEAEVAFGYQVDPSRIHIEAEALQTVVGDIIGWVGHVTVTA